MSARNRVAIVGAGITGLVAARSLSAQGLDVVVVDSSDEVGGKVRTRSLDGVTIEEGPDAFLPRDDRPLQICREIGIEPELVSPAEFGANIYVDGSLKPLPKDTVLGFPTSLRSLARSGLVGPLGVARAALDLVLPGALEGPDVSVGHLATKRFGSRVAQHLIDPLMAGTRAGHIETMSLAAAAPEVDRAARRGPSVMRNLKMPSRYTTYGPGIDGPRFYAPRDGMARLINALHAHLGDVEIRTSTAVESIESRDPLRLNLVGESTLEVDAVVVCTPSFVASDVLRTLDSDAADGLASIEHSSGAVINLVFRAESISPPPYGSGVLIPSSEERTLSACTWSDRKWPQHASANRKAVRAFVGRAGRHPALDLSDPDLVEDVVEDLSRLASLTSDPIAWHVTRWERGLPIYEVGHLDRVESIRDRLGPQGVFLAGASYRGSGMPDCIRQADAAAAAVTGFLRS